MPYTTPTIYKIPIYYKYNTFTSGRFFKHNPSNYSSTYFQSKAELLYSDWNSSRNYRNPCRASTTLRDLSESDKNGEILLFLHTDLALYVALAPYIQVAPCRAKPTGAGELHLYIFWI